MEENTELFSGMESFLKNDGMISTDLLELESPKESVKEVVEETTEKEEGVSLEELESSLKSEKEVSAKEETEETTQTDEVTENDYAKVISGMLKEKGFIEEEVTDFTKLADAFETKFESKITEYKNELPDVIKDLINNYEDGVPLDELVNLKSEQIRLDSIDEDTLNENTDLQKGLIKNFYKSKGFSDSKIDKLITKSEDLDELIDEAKDALEELKVIEKAKEVELKKEVEKQKIAQKETYEKNLNDLNKKITSTKEIIPGIQISEKEQKELLKMITSYEERRGNDAYTKAMLVREQDPMGFEMKLNYYIKMGLFEETPKIDFLTKKMETKITNKFEKQIEELAKKQAEKTGSAGKHEKNDILEAMKNTFKK